MDFIKELGSFSLGSRIKNLSELLMRDMSLIYKDQGLDFEPRWFTFFQLLLHQKEVSVTEIARQLNQTHPAVVQLINILEKKKLIITKKDKKDHRKRLVRLSTKGKKMATDLAPLWELVHEVADDLLAESAPDLIDEIAKVESSLAAKSVYQRIKEKSIQKAIDEMEFTAYEEKYLAQFQELNMEWLNSYLEVSDHDQEILDDPESTIIKENGLLYLLVSNNEVIGSYALKRVNSKLCELLKFAVKKEFRRRKIGQEMLEHAIETAKNLKYKSIILFTHHKLIEASLLYEKNGFEFISGHPDISDQTGRCSLTMQLILKP